MFFAIYLMIFALLETKFYLLLPWGDVLHFTLLYFRLLYLVFFGGTFLTTLDTISLAMLQRLLPFTVAKHPIFKEMHTQKLKVQWLQYTCLQ